MKATTTPTWRLARFAPALSSALLVLATLLSHGQTPPAPSTPSAPPADETITLPAFNVSSDRANGYRATDSMSAARIRTALIDTPATVNVITSDFLGDI